MLTPTVMPTVTAIAIAMLTAMPVITVITVMPIQDRMAIMGMGMVVITAKRMAMEARRVSLKSVQ